jgi:hypothetical protein
MDQGDGNERAALSDFLEALMAVRATLPPLQQALLDELVAVGLHHGADDSVGDDTVGFASFSPPQTPATPPGVPIPYPNLALGQSYPWVRRAVERVKA